MIARIAMKIKIDDHVELKDITGLFQSGTLLLLSKGKDGKDEAHEFEVLETLIMEE